MSECDNFDFIQGLGDNLNSLNLYFSSVFYLLYKKEIITHDDIEEMANSFNDDPKAIFDLFDSIDRRIENNKGK